MAAGEFFPEESFRSWGSYGRALRATGSRLLNRVTARSPEAEEMNGVRARSGGEMKRSLTWWDLMWLGVGSVIGAGIFVLTGQEANSVAGPAIVLSYAISGVSAMLTVFCYTEFAVEIPVAGGSFAYLRVELGDFVAFIAAGNIVLEYLIAGAAVARSWTSYFATLCNHHPNDFRIHVAALADDYSHLDPIAVAVIVLVGILAVASTKGVSRFNYVASISHGAVILFIIIAGLTKAKAANFIPFAPYGPRGIFKASSVLFFAFVGFDGVTTMAEETRNPAKDIPVGLVGSMTMTTALYCLLAATLCLMQPYGRIDPDAPFSVAFAQVGMGWAKYVVAAGALKGMTTVVLVVVVGQARYLTHIARTHMVPPWLAKVNQRTGTPVNATVVPLVAAAAIGFFTDLPVLSNLLSISTLFIFMLVAVALLVRRYYVAGETTAGDRARFVALLSVILASAVATAAYWASAAAGWVAYAVTVPAWFLATLAMQVFVPKARAPKTWGVPCVPWLPSASIAVNIFLLGSIDVMSYARFGVWTAGLLVYYLFVGLHASYDAAMAAEAVVAPIRDAEEAKAGVARQQLSPAESG